MENMLLIDKPANMTSFGVVARVRRVLSEKAGKKVKVGHTGTLDPFATGLLILMYGKGTKRCAEFLKLDKWYDAMVKLDASSTTGDPEGEITTYEESETTETDLKTAAKKLTGKIKQRVPNFSAVKINGRRAYDLARKGETVEMPVRDVEIYSLEILDFDRATRTAKLRCHVSSGTYIRTLAEDLASLAGTHGYLTALRRTKIGKYDVKNAKTLADLGITN